MLSISMFTAFKKVSHEKKLGDKFPWSRTLIYIIQASFFFKRKFHYVTLDIKYIFSQDVFKKSGIKTNYSSQILKKINLLVHKFKLKILIGVHLLLKSLDEFTTEGVQETSC